MPSVGPAAQNPRSTLSNKTEGNLVKIAQYEGCGARPLHACPARNRRSFKKGNLVVEDDIEEGTVHVQPAVVVDESQFAELIHEETDAGARGADHLGEHFLTHLCNDRLRLALLPKMGHNSSTRASRFSLELKR